jgi:hypothetical protein
VQSGHGHLYFDRRVGAGNSRGDSRHRYQKVSNDQP